jgi:hypothetical protein
VSEPRFLIVLGRTQHGKSTPEWPTAEDPFAVRDRPDGSWFSWRLLSGNNREIGRGASAYGTELGCLSAITRIQVRAEYCVPLVGARPTGQWWWQLELDGERMAVAGRAYQRQRECRYNLGQFLLALPAARTPLPSGRNHPDGQRVSSSVVPLHRHGSPSRVGLVASAARVRRLGTAT